MAIEFLQIRRIAADPIAVVHMLGQALVARVHHIDVARLAEQVDDDDELRTVRCPARNDDQRLTFSGLPVGDLHAVAGRERVDLQALDVRMALRQLYRSLIRDRVKEMAAHRSFTMATDIQVYFCDPNHPWQRGSNENTNGLLRQYFPKGISLANISQAKLDAVARELNERPRKTLGYATLGERYRQTIASIS